MKLSLMWLVFICAVFLGVDGLICHNVLESLIAGFFAASLVIIGDKPAIVCNRFKKD